MHELRTALLIMPIGHVATQVPAMNGHELLVVFNMKVPTGQTALFGPPVQAGINKPLDAWAEKNWYCPGGHMLQLGAKYQFDA